jgi:hypothetical protein
MSELLNSEGLHGGRGGSSLHHHREKERARAQETRSARARPLQVQLAQNQASTIVFAFAAKFDQDFGGKIRLKPIGPNFKERGPEIGRSAAEA